MTKPFPEEARWQGGRGPTRFAFTYADYARLYGVTVKTIRDWVSEKRFDPADLKSALALLKQRQEPKDTHDGIRKALSLPKEATRDHLIEAMWTRLKSRAKSPIHAPSKMEIRRKATSKR